MKEISKRILAVVISALILFSVYVPATAATSKGFSYEVVSGSTSVRITGYSGAEANVVIPDIIDGRTVVEISSGAFSEHTGIKSVTVSSNVLRIMKDAFNNCTSLESVVIPASVSSVGDSAFADCVSLKEVSIVSASTAIGYYAFEGCTSLESITIPSTRIGYAAFRNCTSLETIKLLDSVQTVGRYAFDSTAWYKSQPEGVLTIGNVVYAYNGDDTDVVIPEGMRCIADYAFFGKEVKSVAIPGGLYYIGSYAFADCKEMKYLSVPQSVISIGTRAIGYVDNNAVADFTVYCYSDSIAELWAENNSLKTQTIDNCEHQFADWTITLEPDCVTEGSRMHRCIKCNYTETEAVDEKGHAWSGWITISEISCTVDGVKRRTCTVCGLNDDNVTLTSGHAWSNWTVTKDPDCVNEGERNHTCTVCGAVASEKFPALGHTWIVNDTTDAEGWIVTAEPTCDVVGTKSRICSVCETTDNLEIPVKGHKSNEWTVVKDPTAVTPGERQGICTVCGKEFIDEIPVISEPMPDDVKMLVLRGDAKISFNDNRTCIYGVQPNTVANDVLLQFEYPGHIYVTEHVENPDILPEQLSGTDIIGTGCFLFLIKYDPETGEGNPIDTSCVIIKGDLNGDGLITAADAREALRCSAKLTTLLNPYFLAGDLDGNQKISADEARKILRVASKLDKFE